MRACRRSVDCERDQLHVGIVRHGRLDPRHVAETSGQGPGQGGVNEISHPDLAEKILLGDGLSVRSVSARAGTMLIRRRSELAVRLPG